MESRIFNLEQAINGYMQSGISLVAYNGSVFLPAAFNDDKGLFYFVSLLAVYFHIDAMQAYLFFFVYTSFISYIVSIIGLIKICKTSISKITIIFLLTLFYLLVVFRVNDIYFLPAIITCALIPWILFLHKKINENKQWHWYYFIFFLFFGVSISIANYIRFHSATPILFFILIIFLFSHLLFRRKAISILMLFLGVSIPLILFNFIEKERDEFLLKNSPTSQQALAHHVVWHNIYIGLGFIPNKYGIRYDDSIAGEKAMSISPSVAYSSKEYEEILKKETFRIITSDPIFFLHVLFAKLLILLKYFIYFANVGIICFFLRKDYSLFFPFAISLSLSGMQGLVTIPDFQYISGFLAFSMLFGAYYIVCFLDFLFNKNTVEKN